MSASGDGVPEDLPKAVKLFGMAAELGHAGAMYNLGIIHHTGDGVPADPAKAADFFRRSAELGNREAMLILGGMYIRGDGVPEDREEGLRLMRMAVGGDL
jgi:TPR repeat protein